MNLCKIFSQKREDMLYFYRFVIYEQFPPYFLIFPEETMYTDTTGKRTEKNCLSEAEANIAVDLLISIIIALYALQ